MRVRRSHKILLFVFLVLLTIVTGRFGWLPSFSATELGNSHSLFAPLSALLDVGTYSFLAYFLTEVIFGFYAQIRSRYDD